MNQSPDARAKNAVEINAGGERLHLLAEKAVFWPRERTLFVADVHLGKAASFRAAGLAVPSGHSSADLALLALLINRVEATRVVVLGDLVHNRDSYTSELDTEMNAFVAATKSVERVLVSGNHDDSAGLCPESWGFHTLSSDLLLGPLLCVHAPDSVDLRDTDRFVLAGHIHPAVVIRSLKENACLPCFLLKPNQLILPSFGSFTGGHVVTPELSDRVYVVAQGRIFEIPRAAKSPPGVDKPVHKPGKRR